MSCTLSISCRLSLMFLYNLWANEVACSSPGYSLYVFHIKRSYEKLKYLNKCYWKNQCNSSFICCGSMQKDSRLVIVIFRGISSLVLIFIVVTQHENVKISESYDLCNDVKIWLNINYLLRHFLLFSCYCFAFEFVDTRM